MESIKILENSIKPLKGFVNTTPENHGDGITTYIDGRYYNLFDIKPENIDINGIAHSLSKQCR
mgnify:CR=1 FL=1